MDRFTFYSMVMSICLCFSYLFAYLTALIINKRMEPRECNVCNKPEEVCDTFLVINKKVNK